MARPLGPARRIVIIGTAGSGKTSLARLLARRLDVVHVELDALHWEPGWTMADTPVFRARVSAALSGDAWIVDGNYGKVRDLIWSQADTIVWLDYPFPLIFFRLLRRTIRRVVSREQLWNGNRERFLAQFTSRESLFLWAIQTHGRHSREWAEQLTRKENARLQVVRLRSPRATSHWLRSIAARSAPTTLPPSGSSMSN